MHCRSIASLAMLLSAALALSACSLSTSSPSASQTSTSSSTGPPEAAPAATGTTPPVHPSHNSSDVPDWGSGSQGQQAAEDSTLTVADVRIGNHPDEGYSRFVVEFDGQGAPGWSQPQWDVPASTMGKGDPIEVEGAANDDRSIDAAYIDPGFEGEFQVVVGTGSKTYRIFSLTNPTRLVVDIAHS